MYIISICIWIEVKTFYRKLMLIFTYVGTCKVLFHVNLSQTISSCSSLNVVDVYRYCKCRQLILCNFYNIMLKWYLTYLERFLSLSKYLFFVYATSSSIGYEFTSCISLLTALQTVSYILLVRLILLDLIKNFNGQKLNKQSFNIWLFVSFIWAKQTLDAWDTFFMYAL